MYNPNQKIRTAQAVLFYKKHLKNYFLYAIIVPDCFFMCERKYLDKR